MAKYWALKNRWGGFSRLFKSEEELLKRNEPDDKSQIVIFESEETNFTISDLVRQKDRDIKLRGALGELEKYEELYLNFIKLYEEIAPAGPLVNRWRNKTQITEKELYILEMRKLQGKDAFQRYLVKNKKYFITEVSNDPKWYLALLKCHNFIKPDCNQRSYSYAERKYTTVNHADKDEIIKSFTEAKKMLRQKPKKLKNA
jgi:hypothetical protein